MENLKTVLVNYAVCALFGSIFEFISPKRSKDTFRIVSSLILISVIVIPLARIDFKDLIVDFELQQEEIQENNSLTLTADILEREIYKSIEETLINAGVDEYEIYVSTEINEETKEINISGVEILLDESFENKVEELEGVFVKEYGEILKIGVKENGKV